MFDKSKASKVWLRDFTTGEVLPIYMHMFPAQTTDITRVYQGDVLSWVRYVLELTPTQDASHHQDYSIF